MNTTDTMLAAPFLKALGYSLIHFIWQGALVATLLASVRVMLRRSRPNVRYTASCAAMLLMLALPVITAFTVARSSVSFAALSNAQTKTRATVNFARDGGSTATSTPADSPDESTAQGASILQGWRASLSSWLTDERVASLMPWLVSLWLGGVLLLSARVFGGWLLAQRLKRSMTRNAEELWQETVARLSRHLGIRRTVRLCESALAEVPTVIGWLRPVILVPVSALAGMSAQQVEALLAHELAHIRRHDYLVNLLQTVVETLLFYHPAVWWVSRQIRIEREHCCDDMAVAVCGDVLTYARALTELEELRATALPQLAVAANGGSLITRIRRLIEVPKPSAHRGAPWLASLIAMATVFCIWAGAQTALLSKAKEIAKAQPFISSYFKTARVQKGAEKSNDCPLSNPGVIHDPQPVVVKVDIGEDDAVKNESAPVLASEAEEKETVENEVAQTNLIVEENNAHTLILQTQENKDGSKPDFIDELASLGYTNLTIDQLVELGNHGVDGRFIRELRALGFQKLSLEMLIRLSDHGVRPKYIKSMSALYDKLSLEELIRAIDHGVDAEFAEEMASAGYGHLSLEQLIRMKDHGVDTEFMHEMEAAGFARLDLDQLVRAKDHGVGGQFINEIKAAGYPNLTLDQFIRFRDHGVSASFLKKVKAHGFTNLSIDDLVRLRDSDVID